MNVMICNNAQCLNHFSGCSNISMVDMDFYNSESRVDGNVGSVCTLDSLGTAQHWHWPRNSGNHTGIDITKRIHGNWSAQRQHIQSLRKLITRYIVNLKASSKDTLTKLSASIISKRIHGSICKYQVASNAIGTMLSYPIVYEVHHEFNYSQDIVEKHRDRSW